MLTIIIPAYNAENTIIRTLDSLISQSDKNFKVIIIDDGSTDNTYDKIKSKIRNIKDFDLIRQNNFGVSYTRNKGINLASTKYISFLDADDVYLKDFVKDFYKELKKQEFDILAYRNPRKKYYQVNNLNYISYLKHKNTPDTNCWIIKKELIEDHNLQFDERFCWGEDMLFFYNVLFYSKKCVFINKHATKTFNTSNSLSKRQYFNIEDKLMWLEEIKRISDNKVINKLVDGYLVRGTILSSLINGDIDKKTASSYISTIDFTNGFRSLKQNLLIIYYLYK